MESSCNPRELLAIAGSCETAQTEALTPLVKAIQQRHGTAIRGIVYYGSCLRKGSPTAGLVDFYVIVDTYRHAHGHLLSAAANRLIPPNVYYLEVPSDTDTLRCKYAVVSLDDLWRGVTRDFTSSFWGRFAQPMAIVHAADDKTRLNIRACCGQAVITLLNTALPALQSSLPPADTFGAALSLSYDGELRTEGGQRGQQLAWYDAREYQRRLQAARFSLAFPTWVDEQGLLQWHPSRARQRRARLAWRLRRPAGHALSIARLIKACFTFDNAVDYAAWKLQRHTGVEIEVTPRLRRHPLIHVWPILWRLYRQGVLR